MIPDAFEKILLLMNHVNDMFCPGFDIRNTFVGNLRAEQAGFYRYKVGFINNIDVVGTDDVSQFFGSFHAALCWSR